MPALGTKLFRQFGCRLVPFPRANRCNYFALSEAFFRPGRGILSSTKICCHLLHRSRFLHPVHSCSYSASTAGNLIWFCEHSSTSCCDRLRNGQSGLVSIKWVNETVWTRCCVIRVAIVDECGNVLLNELIQAKGATSAQSTVTLSLYSVCSSPLSS